MWRIPVRPAPRVTMDENQSVTAHFTEAPTSDINLWLSYSKDRSSPVFLDSSTVSGVIYIFTGPDDGVNGVDFFLDGSPYHSEGVAPFDFVGSTGGSGGQDYGMPFDTTQLSDGTYIISASCNMADGSTEDISATVYVNNNGGPTPTYDLTMAVDPAGSGTTSPAIGTHTYAENAVVSITATPAAGYVFAYWEGDVANSSSASTTVTMDENQSVTAHFTEAPTSDINLWLSYSNDRSGSVLLDGRTVTGNIYIFTGPDDGVNGVDFFLDGSPYHSEGVAPFDFDGTAGNGTAYPYDTTQLSDGTYIISASCNMADGSTEDISATVYVNNNGGPTPTYDLTMAVDPAGSGTTSPAIGTHTYAENAVVSITATPAAGYVFAYWEGDVANSSSASTTVTMDEDQTVIAHFAVSATEYDLTMAVDPAGTGTTSPAIGTHTYAENAVVSITATPAAGYVFAYWEGDVANSSSASTTVTMDENQSVTAHFTEAPTSDINLWLSYSKDRSSPVFLDGSTVSGVIYIFTGPDDGVNRVNFFLDGSPYHSEGVAPFDFVGSTGGTTGQDYGKPFDTTQLTDGMYIISATCEMADGSTVDISTTVYVNNNGGPTPTYDLTMGVDPAGTGTTSPAIGTHTYAENAVVSITATPAAGYVFAYWEGDVANSSSASTTVTMDENQSVTAHFTEAPTSDINLWLSYSKDRSSPIFLDGSTVSGVIYIFTGPDDGVNRVNFFLDGSPYHSEGVAPFDFVGSTGGTTGQDYGKPFDTTQLTDGMYIISATCEMADGSTVDISTTVYVNNSGIT